MRKEAFSGAWQTALPALLSVVVTGVFLLTGCAASLKSQYADVVRVVQERTGERIEWSARTPADADINEAVRPLLNQPLTVSAALRIALVNNRSLQATLQDIGISRADLIQAGLPANPVLFTRYRRETVGDAYSYELRLTQDFVDLLTLPLRRQVAKRQLEQTKARVAHAALVLASQTRISFYTLQGHLQARDQQRRFVKAMASEVELSRRKQPAGNLGQHALMALELALSQARRDLAGAELRVVTDRERLNRLMGLSGAQAAQWTVAGELPQPPAQEPALENLENQAIQRRIDLVARREETAALQETVKLQQITRWVPFLHAGVDYERETNESRVIGPTMTFALPIFDWGQARIAQTRALLKQSQQRTAAQETEIRSEVREARERLLAARGTVQVYRDEIVPQSEKMTSLARAAAGGGALGTDDELKDRQEETKARLEAIEALQDYWIARARLDAAVNGGMAAEPAVGVLKQGQDGGLKSIVIQ